ANDGTAVFVEVVHLEHGVPAAPAVGSLPRLKGALDDCVRRLPADPEALRSVFLNGERDATGRPEERQAAHETPVRVVLEGKTLRMLLDVLDVTRRGTA